MKFLTELGRSCYLPKQRPLLRSNFRSLIGLWEKIWHRNKKSSAKQQIYVDDLCEENASAQIRIEQHSDFRWQSAKAWKRCLSWFWIDHNQSLQPNWSQMKCNVWKPCSDQRWQDELRFSIWRFFEQSAFVNNHLLCYWPTIHNSISKICPKFQVLSSHFFEVDELLDEHWAKIVQSENISTPIYVECDKMYRSKVCVQEFSYFVSGLDIQLEKSEYDSPVRKKICCRWRNTTSHIPFFSAIDTNQCLSG